MRKTFTTLFKALLVPAILTQVQYSWSQSADSLGKKPIDTAAKAADVPAVKRSPIKTLTDAQFNAIINGDDVNNTAAPASMNYYPLPNKVLRYKKALKLTPEQLKKFDAIVSTLNMKKQEVGVSMIANERTLDSLFRTRGINEGTIIFYGQRYGAYQGELRIALLTACLNSRKILTPMQMNKFYALEKAN